MQTTEDRVFTIRNANKHPLVFDFRVPDSRRQKDARGKCIAADRFDSVVIDAEGETVVDGWRVEALKDQLEYWVAEGNVTIRNGGIRTDDQTGTPLDRHKAELAERRTRAQEELARVLAHDLTVAPAEA